MAAEDIKPSLSDVALHLRTRTVGDVVGGLGGDSQSTDITTFTASTRPTAAEVLEIIDRCSKLIWGKLDLPFDSPRFTDSAKEAVALRAAIWIERSFFRETADQGLLDEMKADITGIILDINGSPLGGTGGATGIGTLAVGTIRTPVAAEADDAGV